MTIFKRIAAVSLLMVASLTVAAGPASASPARQVPPSTCGQLLLCMYNDDGYTGARQDQYARANGTCDGVLYNDRISSIWNGSGKSVRFYNDAGCTGQAFSLANGSGAAHMGISHPTQVDELTSFKWGY